MFRIILCTMHGKHFHTCLTLTKGDPSNPPSEFASLTISPAVNEDVQYPDPVLCKTSKRGCGASQMPRHLTSVQAIQLLAEKKKKMEEEKAKANKKAAHEAKTLE